MPLSDTSPAGDLVRCLDLDDFDLRFDRYRLIQPKAELLMARSLSKYSQLAPVVYCPLEGSLVLVDGFKRLRAARTLTGITGLQARGLEVDEHGAKAAIFNLNRITSKPNELEESWIIYALVHEDGLSQVEVAQMLGRHKSWVNRRLALIERLTEEAREALRLGLLTPTQCHHLAQLQRCNQNAAMQCATAHALTSRELAAAVQLLQSASTQAQTQFVLEKPRQAIRQAQDSYVYQWDPRLSSAGNRVAKRLGMLLDAATKMTHWLRLTGRRELQACDRSILLGTGRGGLGLSQLIRHSEPICASNNVGLSSYPHPDGLTAMQRAIQYHAYGFQSLERILAHFGTPKANWELLSQREQEALQRLTESSRVEARKSQEYQHHFDPQRKAEDDDSTDQPPRKDPPVSGDPENEADGRAT